MTSAVAGKDGIARLRERTGAGILDCKRALEESGADLEKAIEILRKKGLASAAQKVGRSAHDGVIQSYIHHSGKVGVLLEVNCETDFVARTQEFQDLAKELALQIAASNPKWVRREDVPEEVLGKEREIYKQQAVALGKPPAATEKIIEGKLAKFYTDFCLMDQASIRDSSGKTKTGDMITQAISKMGENIGVRRFARFQVGE